MSDRGLATLCQSRNCWGLRGVGRILAGFWPQLPSFAASHNEYGVLIGHTHVIRCDPARRVGLLSQVDDDLDAAGAAVAVAWAVAGVGASSLAVLEGDRCGLELQRLIVRCIHDALHHLTRTMHEPSCLPLGYDLHRRADDRVTLAEAVNQPSRYAALGHRRGQLAGLVASGEVFGDTHARTGIGIDPREEPVGIADCGFWCGWCGWCGIADCCWSGWCCGG